LVRKLVCRRTIFGSVANPAHATATAMHFPTNAGPIFLTDKRTNDRYLVDTWATLSIVTCNQNSSLSGPLLTGADGQPIPSWGFIQKTVQFQQTFHIQFFASRCSRSHTGHKKIQGPCCPRDQPSTVCLHCIGLACPQFAFSGPIHLAIFV
jgi:hypothetical protein